MNLKANLLLLLVSLHVLSSVCALDKGLTDPYANITEFRCQTDGVCLPLRPKYNKKIAPLKSMLVMVHPPQSTVLRKVDVFQSTITLDLFMAGMEWVERRVRLNRKGSDLNWINVDQSYRQKLWIPHFVNRNIKATRTLVFFTPQTGTMYTFYHLLYYHQRYLKLRE